MHAAAIALIMLAVFGWGLTSARLCRADLSAPIVFVLFGVLFCEGVHVVEPEVTQEHDTAIHGNQPPATTGRLEAPLTGRYPSGSPLPPAPIERRVGTGSVRQCIGGPAPAGRAAQNLGSPTRDHLQV